MTTEPRPAPNRARYLPILFAFLVTWEGVQHVAWHDPIDPPGVVTFCIGATNQEHPEINAGQKFTDKECADLVYEDIPKYAGPLRGCIPTFDALPDHRKVALLSEAYNLGPGRVCKYVAPHINAGNIAKACGSLMGFVNSNGEYRRGLERRREAERKLCLMND